jgi:hypothetical protein
MSSAEAACNVGKPKTSGLNVSRVLCDLCGEILSSPGSLHLFSCCFADGQLGTN